MQADFISVEGPTAVVRVQLGVYGLEPLLKAAHVFTGKCFVHIEDEGAGSVLCRLKPIRPLDNSERLAGEFANELIDQSLRARLSASTEPVRRILIAQAFSNTNLLHPEFDAASSESDPAGLPHR
jgi:His-Xaa-Ser system protein HxsD